MFNPLFQNAKQLPVLTAAEKVAKSSQLRLEFPVSSGSQHRAKEEDWTPVEPFKAEWVPVEKDKPKTGKAEVKESKPSTSTASKPATTSATTATKTATVTTAAATTATAAATSAAAAAAATSAVTMATSSVSIASNVVKPAPVKPEDKVFADPPAEVSEGWSG